MSQVTTAEVTEVSLKAKPPADLFLMFGIDEHRKDSGSEMPLGGTIFKVAPLNSPRYQAANQKLRAELVKKFGHEDAEKDTEDQLIAREAYYRKEHRKLLAKHILLGWDVLVLRGKTYTKYDQNVAEMLTDMDGFIDELIPHSNDRKNYLATSIDKEEEKN